jgi:RNA polymerase sigma-70 factor (ECF subfamily)
MGPPERENAQPSYESGAAGQATSATLLLRMRGSDPMAWERFVAIYAPLVWSWCRLARLQDQDGADVVQEVFRAVTQSIGDFRQQPTGTFRGWLRTITRHKIVDLCRERLQAGQGVGGSDHQARLAQIPIPTEIEEATDDADAQRLVQRIMELLRPEFSAQAWQAFWRTAVDGCSATDVAHELGMTAGAVRVAKCRVLQRLRLELQDLPDVIDGDNAATGDPR